AGDGPLPREAHGDVFLALRKTMRDCRLPPQLFRDLVSAFRQDVTTTRDATWDAVLDYCRRSANPVGRLVLRVAGYENAALDAASDAVCTALQLANFWQDFEIDWRKGRLYVPASICEPAGEGERDLDRRALPPQWRSALADVTGRTRALFAAG